MTTLISVFLIFAMTQLIAIVFCGRFYTNWKTILFSFVAWPVLFLRVLIDPRNQYREWHRLAAIVTYVGFGFVPVGLLIGYDHPYDPYVVSGVVFVATALWFVAGMFFLNASRLSREFRRALTFIKEEELKEEYFLGRITEDEFNKRRDQLLWEWVGGC